MRSIILAIALSSVATVSFAQEAVKNVVSENIDTTQLAITFKAVCDSKAIKSKNLTGACTLQQMPKPLKSGKAFRASGLGAEVNVIFNNLELINN